MIEWHSQAGQDEWVHSIVGDSGYFVDVGAHDGVVHSNTYALEQRGWTGLCIEPNRAAYEQLRARRSCSSIPCAVSAQGGTVPFDGIRVGNGEPVLAHTLDYLLSAFTYRDVVDYLSIDVEGHELEVLDGMDFDRCHVRLITIEHNLYCDGPERKDAIHDRLTRHGFERVRENVVAPGYGEYEDWYQHS